MTKNELYELVEESLKEVDFLYKSGFMPKDKYFQCLVSLAYEYMLEDDLERCMILLGRCDLDYFDNEFKKQMAADLIFYRVGQQLKQSLLNHDITLGKPE